MKDTEYKEVTFHKILQNIKDRIGCTHTVTYTERSS